MISAADEALPPLIELDRATVCRGGAPVLREMTLRIAQGRHAAILGPNGCGKSTLVKLLARELYPVARDGSPSVRVLGRERWDVFALREQLGIVSPDAQSGLLAATDLSAEDVVVSGFFASRRLPPHRTVTPAMRERAREALAEAGAAHLGDRPLPSLSTGEARRVLIARALAHRPRALLLDEPTTGLDVVARQRFLATLREVARQGTTLVLATHHVEEVLPEVRHVVLMKDGRVFDEGDADAMMTSARMSALYGAPLTVEHRSGRYAIS